MMRDKDASIAFILEQGLVKPRTSWQQAKDILQTIGLRFIFWDTVYSVTFAILTIAVVISVFLMVPNGYRYSATVATAPLLYLLISVFTEAEERDSGLFQLKQTCRYTARHITALRIACYAVIGTLFSMIVALINVDSVFELLSMLPLGLLALFVCAVPQVAIIRFARHKWTNALYAGVWIFVNLYLTFQFGSAWESTLTQIPWAVSLGVALLCTITILIQIKKMLMEAQPYAHAE
jgi:hypothetical protein